ncbi:MAG: hypothetical protein K5776_05160 [Lachnospiraceae bacterium]|nr:hypothetical protein [Lachnospiraceae bacterium]
MDENTKLLKKIHTGQIVNRVFLIVGFVLLMINLGSSIFIGIKIKQFTTTIEPAIDVITKIDPEEVNKTLTTLNSAIDVFKINETLDALGKIDFQGFQDVVSGIDVDKLNKTLENINDATQFMKRIGEGMNDFLSQFGIGKNN